MRKYQKHKRPCSPYDRFSKAEISTTRHCYYDFCCYSNILPINFLSWSVCIQLQPIFCSTSSNLQPIGSSISNEDSRECSSQESTSQECASQESASQESTRQKSASQESSSQKSSSQKSVSQESARQECATPAAVPYTTLPQTPVVAGPPKKKRKPNHVMNS